MTDTAPVETALIVAGGRGTRLQPLTYGLPKPLVPFCGAPFIEGVIRRLAAAGVDEVHLIVGADTEPFERLRPAIDRLGVRLEMVPEPEPLDTAGGVRAVADRFDDAIYVLNGDILTDVDYAAVGARHRETGADATLVLTEVEDTSSYGVAVREEGTRIQQFVEKPRPGSLPDQDAINAGTYVLQPEVMSAHDEGPLSFERQVFPGLLDRGGHIEGMVWDGVWADLGTPDRYREGHRIALSGQLDWPTLEDVEEIQPGVRIAAGADVADGVTIEPPVVVLPGAVLGAGVTLGPVTVVGRDAVVGRDTSLRESVLHAGVEIGAGLDVRGLIAGEGARIQSGAGLGRDVVLGAGEVVIAEDRLDDAERRPPPE